MYVRVHSPFGGGVRRDLLPSELTMHTRERRRARMNVRRRSSCSIRFFLYFFRFVIIYARRSCAADDAANARKVNATGSVTRDRLKSRPERTSGDDVDVTRGGGFDAVTSISHNNKTHDDRFFGLSCCRTLKNHNCITRVEWLSVVHYTEKHFYHCTRYIDTLNSTISF